MNLTLGAICGGKRAGSVAWLTDSRGGVMMEERASLVTVDMCCQEKKVPLQGVNVIWCVCGVCEARGLVGDGGEMPRTLG